MIDFINPKNISLFRQSLASEFDRFIAHQKNRYDPLDCLKIDLHCHDHNSDVPDELWGRILALPETWLKTKKLIKVLKKNHCDVITITNHNNARSCRELQQAGEDVLVGAEFTCYFNEYHLFVHVLAYGFSPEQEKQLNEKRSNIYQFLRYTTSEDIPVILPHPLYFYTRNDSITLELFEKLAVMFQRFEVLNGQRDRWQSVLTINWIDSLTPQKIRDYALKHKLDLNDFDVDPDQPKILTGGSDDHMGIFAGKSGSYLYVPNLNERLKTEKPSALALEALRSGHIAAYGNVAENQKLNIALLDYFSQIATRIEEPGLLRLLFHRGTLSDKAACFVISNLLQEMKQHKNTHKFLNFIHQALRGKKPSKLVRWKIKKDYRFCIDHLERIAGSKKNDDEHYVELVNHSINELFSQLNKLIVKRVKQSSFTSSDFKMQRFSTEELTRNFEIPTQLSALFKAGKNSTKGKAGVSIHKIIDQLSFPVMVAVILFGTTLASTRLLYQNRRFLNQFAQSLGKNTHPKRALYLTDTLRDKNGVSSSLSAKLTEIQRNDMPIDFLICHASAKTEAHLHVVRPITQFNFEAFGEQQLRIPDLMEICKIFYQGGYDRVICSTEGPMALIALILKHMFNVPVYFFMHTDWLEFIKQTTDLNAHERDRIRRLLRFFYQQFNGGVFVLNNEHKQWLCSHHMQLDAERVFLTAHHSAMRQQIDHPLRKQDIVPGAAEDTPVLLFSGRLSQEKGVMDLVDVYEHVKWSIPDVRLVIAGSGPAEDLLKNKLPDAVFIGWVDKQKLAELYSVLDILVFPSRFDTFGNVIVEAFSYGMPVIAYNCKGPADIIEHNESGFLVENSTRMSEQIICFLSDITVHTSMKEKAIRRSKAYQADPIMQQFLLDLGLAEKLPATEITQRSAA